MPLPEATQAVSAVEPVVPEPVLELLTDELVELLDELLVLLVELLDELVVLDELEELFDTLLLAVLLDVLEDTLLDELELVGRRTRRPSASTMVSSAEAVSSADAVVVSLLPPPQPISTRLLIATLDSARSRCR